MKLWRKDQKVESDRGVPVTRPRSLFRTISLVWQKIFEDEIFGRAAQLAYYWFFSLFPLFLFLTTLLAYLPISKELDQWLSALSNILPPEAYSLIRSTFDEITGQQRHGLLSFSVIALIWGASSGMEAIISSLNIAFDAPTKRPWWRERLLALSLTLGLAVFILSAMTLIFFGGSISGRIASTYGFDGSFKTLWSLAQWPIIILLLLLALELIYYFAPNIKHEKNGKRWKWLTPGTLFALFFWLAISYGLRIYVSNFGNYNATYGALGGVMVLMLWLYFTGIAILVGGEINSVTRMPEDK
jgi:membrane protein